MPQPFRRQLTVVPLSGLYLLVCVEYKKACAKNLWAQHHWEGGAGVWCALRQEEQAYLFRGRHDSAPCRVQGDLLNGALVS